MSVLIVGGSIAVEFFAEAFTKLFASVPSGYWNLLRWRDLILSVAILVIGLDMEATASAMDLSAAHQKQ